MIGITSETSRKLPACAAAALVVMIGRPMQADAGITVHAQPSSTVVNVGETFFVTLTADIAQSSAIVGFGMDLDFNAAIVNENAAQFALGSSFSPLPGPGGDGDGLGGLILPPTPPIWGDSVLLATLTFTAIGPGVSPLLGGISSGDPLEGFVMPGGQFAAVSFVPSSVTVVPAPSALTALCAVVGFRRGRRREPRRHDRLRSRLESDMSTDSSG